MSTPKPAYVMVYISIDEHGGRDNWAEDAELEFGYFTTREQAEQKADLLNVRLRNAYESYRTKTFNDNRERQAKVINAVAAWKLEIAKNEVLRASKFEVTDPTEPSGAWADVTPVPYEEWVSNANRYGVAELVPGVVG